MFENQTIVIKVGGSLFDLPDFGTDIQKLIAENQINQPLIVSGGGETADLVRKWHETHDLSDEDSHDLAIRAMSFNNNLLLRLIPSSVIVQTQEEAENAWKQDQVPILDCPEYLDSEESKEEAKLHHNWDTSSDSIAAWVAVHWTADALVLVKSTAIHSMDLEHQSEYIDPEFNQFIPKLKKIGWCNLRSPNPEIIFLSEHD